MRKLLWPSVLGLCVACGTQEQGEPTERREEPADEGPEQDEGRPSPGDGDGDGDRDDDGQNEGEGDAGKPAPLDDAGVEAPRDDASTPGNPGDEPVPTAPCGTDLDVHNGTVRPDFGSTQGARDFSGDPVDDGPLEVRVEDHTLDNPDPARDDYKVTVYAPEQAGQGSLDAPLPLLLLLPGFSYKHTDYPHFSRHFASHGLVVLGITPAHLGFADPANNPANVAEILAALDWLLAQEPHGSRIDRARIGIVGHSAGGKLAFYAASSDARFKLVIGWDPQNGGGPPCAIAGALGQDCNAWPVAPLCDPPRDREHPGMLAALRAESLVFAARDTLVTNEKHMWAEHFYRGAPSPSSLVLFPAARHLDWASDGEVSAITRRIQLGLVLTRFGVARGLERYLPGGEYAASEATVEVHTK